MLAYLMYANYFLCAQLKSYYELKLKVKTVALKLKRTLKDSS